MKTRAGVAILLAVLFVGTVSADVVELAGQGFIPEPNQEITIQIQTDIPLFAMDIIVKVEGNANIISAMSPTDCNEFGWDIDWPVEPYIDDVNNVIYDLGGVSWLGEANGIVGYFKFRYNSGQVIVSILDGFVADANCESVGFSDKTLIFGEPDPNDYNEQGDSSSQNVIIDENTPATAESPNDINLPIVSYWQIEQEKRAKCKFNSMAISLAEAMEFTRKPDYSPTAKFVPGLLSVADGWSEAQGEGRDSPESLIEIYSDITTNQIWTANNEYYVTDWINVKALLVIEPGTIIYFAETGAIFVNDGGTLISKGTPDNPIIYTSDYEYYAHGYYFCPICIESTASPATTVTYSHVDSAVYGILTDDIRLDNPIENNFLHWNSNGIAEWGTRHTDIINNLIYYSDISGIDVNMVSTDGQADANSRILIADNTCHDYQYFGITISGAADEADAGLVELANNIVSGSYTAGLNFGGWAAWIINNTGYYANTENKSDDFPETNPVIATQNPYVNGTGFNRCYLNQNCPFIDAGLQYVEETSLIGKTTDINNAPDSNMIDIGFHYPNWNYSNIGDGNALIADYDGNGKVDFKDFAILANGWKSSYDMNDLSTMADEWLLTISGHPLIAISVNGDVNSLSGEVSVSVANCSYLTSQVYIFMDGQLMGETDYDEDEGTPGITINTPSYRNGSHLFKALVIDYNNLITLSENLAVDFNNPLQCLSINDTYEPNQPLRLLGISATDSNLMVKLSKWNGETIWSQQTSGNLDINIPGNVLAGQIYDVSIEQEISGMLILDSSWEPIWERAIAARYDLNESYKFAIFLPTAYFTDLFPFYSSADSRKKAVAGIINDCNIMGIKYIILYGDQCTWENFTRVLTGPKSSSILYVYLVSRGSTYLSYGAAQRTYFKLTDGYVVSNLNTPLGGGWDGRSDVHSMADLGLWDSGQLKLVWIDICYNGKYPDMANAWIKFEEPTLNRLYISWNSAIQTSNESCFCDWTAFFFGYPNPNEGFGLYGANTYYQAFEDACRWNHVCDSAFIAGKVQTYGDTSVRFTTNR